MGDHTESLQVDFDPKQISYKTIVESFWKSHNPIGAMRSTQYMSAIWFTDEDEREVIVATVADIEERLQRKIVTAVSQATPFYRAEDYHQKYGLQRHKSLMQRFGTMYPQFDGFVDSTAAARLNGFASRHGSMSLLEEERERYGVPTAEIDAVVRR